jgi:PAS domain S-box-containing protein
MKRHTKELYKTRAIQLFIASIILTTIVFAFIGTMFWNHYESSKEVTKQALEVENIEGNILLYDEMLTMSAHMYTSTGDPEWEERYNTVIPLLDSALAHAEKVAPNDFKTIIQKTDAANKALIEKETQAFELTKKDSTNLAYSIITDVSYQEYKKTYANGMHELTQAMKKQVHILQEKNENRATLAGTVTLILFPFLLFVWFNTLRLIRKYISTQNELGLRIAGQNEDLERKVIQRTTQVQQQNQKLQASEEELQQNLEELQSTNDQIQVIQKEVEQKELNLRSLIDNTDDGIYSMDKNYCFITANQKVIDQYAAGGVQIEKGMSVIDLAPTEKIRNDFKELYDIALIKGERTTVEYDYSDKSVGIVAFYELHINPITDNQKQIIGCSVFARDITERKQKEEQNQLLKKLIDNTSDAVQVATTEGQFIYMNKVGIDRLGLQGEDISNYTTADIESVFKEEGVWQGHVEDVKAVDTFILQSKNFDKSTGREFPVEVSIKYAEINGKGFMIAVSRDVTEQQNREKEIQNKNKALQASEEELQQNLEELQSTQELLEKQKEDVENSYKELQTTQKQLIQSEKMASLGQLVANIAHEINTPLGAIRSSADSIEVILLETLPNLSNFIEKLDAQTLSNFNEFVTKSIHRIDILSSREKRSFRYDLIEEFESIATSSIENLANLIVDMNMYEEKVLIEFLLRKENAKEILDMAYSLSTIIRSNRTIKEATDRAAKTVFALKNFARQDHTDEKLELDINQTINTTLTLYHNQIKQGIDVIRNFEEIPNFLGYPDELMQVWTNLIHNAIQAMKGKGKLFVSTQNQENSVLISIKDTGGGIPKGVQDKIFDAFFTTKPIGEGSGLGLDITKKIIEKHEGKIWFESEEGIGTTFFVEISI